jgi:outer membrane protein assembly factor BamB
MDLVTQPQAGSCNRRNFANSSRWLRSPRVLSALILASALSFSHAADWPQFMGPNGDATSSEKGLLRAWPAGGPKVLWATSMGPGYGGAAIRQSKVYVLDRVEQQKDVLRCFDLISGEEEWTFGYDAPGRLDHDGSRSTPAVTGKHVFTIGPFGHVHCLDRATHQVVWKKDLVNDYGSKRPNWGMAQSPTLYNDMVILAPQSQKIGLLALDQATGQERWRSEPIGPMAYGSALLLTLADVEQFVIVNNPGVTGIRASDGKVLWKYAHECRIPVPNVTAMGKDRLFVTGAYRAGSAVIQVAGSGDAWTATELGRNEQIGGHCHPALFHKEHVYVLCNVNERKDGMVCFDAEGKVLWQTKNDPNLDKGGSILTGDGLMYVMDGRTGELHIVDPSPAGFKSLGATKLLDGREIWAPLALADGKLLIRDQSQLKCVDIRGR